MTEQTGSENSPPAMRMRRDQFLRRGAGALLSMTAMGSFLTACGRSSPEGAATGGEGGVATGGEAGPGSGPPAEPTGVLRIANPGEPTSLDVKLSVDTVDLGVHNRNVYDGLINLPRGGGDDFEPALATEWQVSDDAREWRFQLRPDVRMHDGEMFDSTVYKNSYQYFIGDDSSFGGLLPHDVEIDDSDPMVLVVKAKDPIPDFLRIQLYVRAISPTVLRDGAEAVTATPSGAGPFRFVSYDRGSNITLEAFEDFWGEGPYLEQLLYRILPDPAARTSALQAGDIDIDIKAEPRSARRFETDNRFEVFSTDTTSVHNLFMISNEAGDLSDVRVRQALAHAVDKQAIVDTIVAGYGEVADNVIPPGVYGYVKPATTYSYDPDRAKSLLREAGYGPGELKIQMMTAAGVFTQAEDVARAVQGAFESVGVDASLSVREVGVFVAEVYGPEQPVTDVFNGELGNSFGTLHIASGLIWGASRIEDEQLEPLKTKILTTPDGDERLAALEEFQNRGAELAPIIPLFRPKFVSVARSDLQGYYAPTDGYIPNFGQAYVSNPSR